MTHPARQPFDEHAVREYGRRDMPDARRRRWQSVAVIAAVAVAGLSSMPAPAQNVRAAGPAPSSVDFSWLPVPTDIVASREIRQSLRVPPLLTQACRDFKPKDVSFLGEDYDYNRTR